MSIAIIRQGGCNYNIYNYGEADAQRHHDIDNEFNIDQFDQLIGYSPIILAMWPKMRERERKRERTHSKLADEVLSS